MNSKHHLSLAKHATCLIGTAKPTVGAKLLSLVDEHLLIVFVSFHDCDRPWKRETFTCYYGYST